MIYFCQGCSAVLNHRVNHCPHCGRKQYNYDECENCGAEITEEDEYCPECDDLIERDEDKTRYCPNCGYDLDTDGRDLELKYCNGVDCGKEIGGLIRYSEETGEPLSADEIIKANDYKKELTDWLSSVLYGGNTFYRMLYIYDKSGNYKGQNFLDKHKAIFNQIDLHYTKDFTSLSDPATLDIISNEKGRYSGREIPVICLIDINKYDGETISHKIIEYLKASFNSGIKQYDCFDKVKNIDSSFVFVSDSLPEEVKIGSLYDKHYLIISPDVLESVDLAAIYNELKAREER